MSGLPKKYAKMGFKKGWAEYKKTNAYKNKMGKKPSGPRGHTRKTSRKVTRMPAKRKKTYRKKAAMGVLGTGAGLLSAKIVDDRHIGAVHAVELVMGGDIDGGINFLMGAIKGPMMDLNKWFETLKMIFGIHVAKAILVWAIKQIGFAKTISLPFLGRVALNR